MRVVARARNGGPAAARDSGLAEVGTPLVAFLDAGCTPVATGDEHADRGCADVWHSGSGAVIDGLDGWLTPLLAHFADPQLALVAPRIVAGHVDVPAAGLMRGPRRRVVDRVARYEPRRSPLDLGEEAARVAPRTRVRTCPRRACWRTSMRCAPSAGSTSPCVSARTSTWCGGSVRPNRGGGSATSLRRPSSTTPARA